MRNPLYNLLLLLCIAPIFVLLASWDGVWQTLFARLYPDLSEYLYPRFTLWQLIWQHLVLVASSSLLSVVVGMGLGMLATRNFGRDFLPSLNGLVSVGQTFPPVAVLALAVPVLGFGGGPTIVALFLYGLLPIVRNTVTGLESVEPAVREAASGMGMSELQTLRYVELPLSMPVIMAGIKTSVIINIGTATIGATIGAGGLGAPIVTGLASDNTVFILQGSILAALFAVIVDQLLELLEYRLTGRSG